MWAVGRRAVNNDKLAELDNSSLVPRPLLSSYEENGLVNQVKFLGPITGMW